MNKKDKQRFLKRIVILSLCVGLILTATCVKSWWSTNYVDSYSLTALLAFWGGELLITCLIKLLGDDPTALHKNIKTHKREYNTI
jgi:hypothetical protein